MSYGIVTWFELVIKLEKQNLFWFMLILYEAKEKNNPHEVMKIYYASIDK